MYIVNKEQKSFPLRERGLKPESTDKLGITVLVVPLAGTWIETCRRSLIAGREMSFPLRERGLKHNKNRELNQPEPSFPLRERGLKLLAELESPAFQARSFPLRERGLKPSWEPTYCLLSVVPLAGTWIETLSITLPVTRSTSRSPCGNVD